MNDRPLYSKRLRGIGPVLSKQPQRVGRKVLFVIITVLLGTAVVLYFGGIPLTSKKETAPVNTPIKIVDENDFQQVIMDELFKLGLKEEWVTRKKSAAEQGRANLINVRIPTDVPLVLANLRLHQLMRQAGGTVAAAEENFYRDQLILNVSHPSGAAYRLFLKQERDLQRGIIRLALVFDQLGAEDDPAVQELMALKQHLTLAVVPGTQHCKALARAAQANGMECFIQLPFKTREQVLVEPDKHAFLTSFSDNQVRKHLTALLGELPQTAGFSHLPGSLPAGTRKELCTRIIKNLKKQPLYYLDPDTSRGSPVATVAQGLGVKSAKASVMIGHQQSLPEIRAQLEMLTKKAVEKGRALGIGHCSRETVATVKEYLPQLDQRGVQLVYVSELVE
jgi:polysaccharide deacetylase 2 family uncharacterized protein YibQ